MSIHPPDDIDIIDLADLDRSAGTARRRSRQSPPPPTQRPAPPFADPRLMVPLLLFLLAILVIFLAWRSRSSDDDAVTNANTELAQSITDAELRAGFDGLVISDSNGVITIDGEAANATDVAAIGAVARSVEGTNQINNRVTVEGGSIDAQFPATESALTNDGAALENQLNNLGRITFEAGSADLTGEGTIVIDNVARLLEQSPGVELEIHGHTDSDGEETTNQVLSQQRAQAVASALAQRGINAGRITAIGFGESDPIAPNVTADGRATNRRIEFVIP